MFEKNIRLAYLLDFYYDVLDEHGANIMKAYYEDDLSLAEIAEGEGISRQGVRHIIKKCEEQILFLEEKLGMAKRYAECESAIEKLRSTSGDARRDVCEAIDDQIDEVVKILVEGV